jgi:general secretion pathway protein J
MIMSRRGFTLVEVLVALALMAVLASMSWQGIASVADAKRVSDIRVNETLRVGTVLSQWEQDLAQLHDTPVLPSVLAFDGATLRMVRRREDGVQVVAWALRDGRWMRWASPVVARAGALQESWLNSLQLLGNEPGQLTLLDGISGWQVYFYRGNSWTNAQSSGDVVVARAPGASASAPAPARTQPPSGVRLVLTLQPRGGEGSAAPTLTRDVLLSVQAQQ